MEEVVGWICHQKGFEKLKILVYGTSESHVLELLRDHERLGYSSTGIYKPVVTRYPEADKLCMESSEGHIEWNLSVKRSLGWGNEPRCTECNLSTMDRPNWELCPQCSRCPECGHHGYCEEQLRTTPKINWECLDLLYEMCVMAGIAFKLDMSRFDLDSFMIFTSDGNIFDTDEYDGGLKECVDYAVDYIEGYYLKKDLWPQITMKKKHRLGHVKE